MMVFLYDGIQVLFIYHIIYLFMFQNILLEWKMMYEKESNSLFLRCEHWIYINVSIVQYAVINMQYYNHIFWVNK